MQLGNLSASLSNINLWPNWLRVTILGGIFLAVLAAGYMLFIANQVSQLNILATKEIQLKQALEAKDSEVKNLAAFQAQQKTINERLAILLSQLPDQAALPQLMENIFLEGNKAGIHFNEFKPLAENNKGAYTEIPIQMTVSGSYRNLARFISHLVALNTIVRVDNFIITPAPNHQVEGRETHLSNNDHLIMRISIMVYRNVSLGK